MKHAHPHTHTYKHTHTRCIVRGCEKLLVVYCSGRFFLLNPPLTKKKKKTKTSRWRVTEKCQRSRNWGSDTGGDAPGFPSRFMTLCQHEVVWCKHTNLPLISFILRAQWHILTSDSLITNKERAGELVSCTFLHLSAHYRNKMPQQYLLFSVLWHHDPFILTAGIYTQWLLKVSTSLMDEKCVWPWESELLCEQLYIWYAYKLVCNMSILHCINVRNSFVSHFIVHICIVKWIHFTLTQQPKQWQH